MKRLQFLVIFSRLHIPILTILSGKTGLLLWVFHDLGECLLFRIQIAGTIFGLLTQEKRREKNANIMKKENKKKKADELRQEYDLSKLRGGVRGKYARQFKKGTNLVLLSPDVAKYFQDEESVNDALKSLVDIAKTDLRLAN
jgi:hypothetical protein